MHAYESLLKKTEMRDKLVVFCLEYDPKSILVSHSFYWIQELSKHFDKTSVVCVRANNFKDGNVEEVIQLGGGSTYLRLKGLFKLLAFTIRVSRKRQSTILFHHMLIQPLAFFGWIYRLMRIPQVLWYSHSACSPTLKIGTKFCDAVVSPSSACFPIANTGKLFEVGHGVSFERFASQDENSNRRRDIVVLGRISQIKNIEALIHAVASHKLTTNREIAIDLIGPILDEEYGESLKDLARSKNVELNFVGVRNSTEIPADLGRYRYSYNGNPRTLDKSAVEAAFAGCLILSEVLPVLTLTGMEEIWMELGVPGPKLSDQLRILDDIGEEAYENYKKKLIETSRKNNELSGTILRITEVLQRVSQ